MTVFSNPAAQDTKGTVYVVDDDDAIRDSLRWLLEANDYKVELYDSGESFIAKYDPNAIAVLVLDVRMPGMSGLEVQEHLLARKADLPIIFITGHGDVPMAVRALKKGAVDFIEKPFQQAALKAQVEHMLTEARERRMKNERQSLNEALLAKLTPREQQVLERIVAGRLNKQIADDLGISIKTVEAHRASIMDKTNSGTVADLMRVVLDTSQPAKFLEGNSSGSDGR
ncbi:MAG: response regulator transcription factor [Sutterellaceae bacterium]|nr:response regulator transcription factor [Sutterellaceae bacterium]MDD7441511.1 response regulator transcription factor [Sutterellaceae bacterium]MDY2867351.1 response regulator transcription factor [Mesosutterella sp.]